jgi:hypothetical protein
VDQIFLLICVAGERTMSLPLLRGGQQSSLAHATALPREVSDHRTEKQKRLATMIIGLRTRVLTGIGLVSARVKASEAK